MFKKLVLLGALFCFSSVYSMEEDQVTIQTSDGKDFKVSVLLAKQSVTIKNLIEDAGIDNPIPLPNIQSSVWTKIQDLLPHAQTDNKKAIEDALKALDGSTLIAFIVAVNYLDIPVLLKASMDVAKSIDVKKMKAQEIAALPREIRNPIILAQMERILGPLTVKQLALLSAGVSVYSVCVTPDGSKIVSGGGFPDKSIRIWDINTHKELAVLEGHTEIVQSVCVTPDGSKIVSGSDDGTIRIWDINTHKELAVLKGHTKIVKSVCVTPDGSKIISGGDDGIIRIWDLNTHKEPAVLKGHTDQVNSVCVTPDGSKIVSGSSDKTIRIWDIQSHKELAVLKGHTGPVVSVCVTPDGSKIVSGSFDKTIRIWDIQSHKEPAVLKGHTMAVKSVCVTPDGSKIVSGSLDKTIRIWDLKSHKELAVLKGHTGPVVSVCVTPDGSKVVSGSNEVKIRIWGDISVLDISQQAIAGMNAEQAQQIWQYLQGAHAEGWQGIKAFFK